MKINNFTITTRDGSKDIFSLDKITNAIEKAFENITINPLPLFAGALFRFDRDLKAEHIIDDSKMCGITIPEEIKSKYPNKYMDIISSLSICEGKDGETIAEKLIAEKLNTKNIKSEKKQILKQALESISENTSKEEIIKEIEKVVEENKIDRRVFNGRKEECDFCESLTNDQVWDIFVTCYEKFMHGTLEASKILCQYIQAFAQALYETFERTEFMFDGKIAFICRYTESKLGEALSFGVRAVQKGWHKFVSFLRHGSSKENDLWREREQQRYSCLRELVDKIKEVFEIALQPAN